MRMQASNRHVHTQMGLASRKDASFIRPDLALRCLGSGHRASFRAGNARTQRVALRPQAFCFDSKCVRNGAFNAPRAPEALANCCDSRWCDVQLSRDLRKRSSSQTQALLDPLVLSQCRGHSGIFILN